jgi:hypothetical protein
MVAGAVVVTLATAQAVKERSYLTEDMWIELGSLFLLSCQHSQQPVTTSAPVTIIASFSMRSTHSSWS